MAEHGPGALGAGHQFGRYTVVEFFAAGGMAEVYRARDVTTGEEVALKVLAGDVADDRQFRDRFLRETRVVTRLSHPHILPVLSSGEDNGVLYIATPFVDPAPYPRPDLSAVIAAAAGGLPVDVIVRTISQVADALHAAHEQGLVHRDVTSGNILLDRNGTDLSGAHAYLTDFGITRRATSRSTRPGGFIGTLQYASPEQIHNEPLDRRTDVYGLACVAYEMLTGTTPHADAEDPGALVFAILDSAPPPVTARRPDLPPAFDDVLTAALAKDRRRRLPTPRALAEALVAAKEGTWTPPAVLTDPSAADIAPPDVRIASGATATAPPARRRSLLQAAAALAFVVVSGGVAIAWPNDDVPAPTDAVVGEGTRASTTGKSPGDVLATEGLELETEPSPEATAPAADPGADGGSSLPDDGSTLPDDSSLDAGDGSAMPYPGDADSSDDPAGGDDGADAAPGESVVPQTPVQPDPPATAPEVKTPPPVVQPPGDPVPPPPAPPSGQITAPTDGAQVESRLLLQGVAHVPDGHQLWTLIKAANNTYYTTSNAPAEVTSAGVWSTRVKVGRGEQDVGTSAELLAVVAPIGGQIQAGIDARGNRFSAQFDAVPGDSVEVARITVVMVTWVP